MVNRAALLIVVLSVIFVALGAFLLHLQLPPDTVLTDLLRARDSLPLLLVQSYTLPRISIALLAGGGLAFAALLLQQVMSNPLASDNTLGISGGARFGLFLSAIFAPQLLEYGSGNRVARHELEFIVGDELVAAQNHVAVIVNFGGLGG